jgi:hypothetical protein
MTRVLLLIACVATSLSGCCRTPPPEVVVHMRGCELPPVPAKPSLSSARACGKDLCLSVAQAKALEVYLIRMTAWAAQAVACTAEPTSRPTTAPGIAE